MTIEREQVLRYRARVSHLDAKLAAGSFVEAAWCGLQDSVPRGGVVSLHARVEGTQPGSWEDPSLVQIWFRGGADYIVPKADAGVFTLGCYPRDPDRAAALEKLADDVHRVLDGRTMFVRDVSRALAHEHPTLIRLTALTGRAHIRWDASNIWLIGVERPEIDPEDARIELARRFVHWFGPTTKDRLAWWTKVEPSDATTTWDAIESDLVSVEVAGRTRYMLEADVDALEIAEPIRGVRLIPPDDPFTKTDKDIVVGDDALRAKVFPAVGSSLGYIPGAVLVDGEVVGAWQRQQRKVTIHPWGKLSDDVRAEIESEALAMPIASKSKPTVRWE